MARLGTLLLKGAGALLLAFIVLSVIATLVGIVLSIVATVVTLAVLVLVVLAIGWLVSTFWGDDVDLESVYAGTDAEAATADDPADELRSQYVEGRLDDEEFERELDRLLETDDRSRDFEPTTDRSHLRER